MANIWTHVTVHTFPTDSHTFRLFIFAGNLSASTIFGQFMELDWEKLCSTNLNLNLTQVKWFSVDELVFSYMTELCSTSCKVILIDFCNGQN